MLTNEAVAGWVVGEELPVAKVTARRPYMLVDNRSPIFDDNRASEHGFKKQLVPGGGSRVITAHLCELFRMDWLHSGKLSINHLTPVYDKEALDIHMIVRGIEETPEGRRVYFELWAEKEDGTKTTRGDASCLWTGTVS
jgi:hypothetical protein